MAHQIFNQIQKVKSAASKLSGAKALNLSSDYQGEKRLVLNVQVETLRRIIEEARQDHAGEFGYDFAFDINPKDLMDMGY